MISIGDSVASSGTFSASTTSECSMSSNDTRSSNSSSASSNETSGNDSASSNGTSSNSGTSSIRTSTTTFPVAPSTASVSELADFPARANLPIFSGLSEEKQQKLRKQEMESINNLVVLKHANGGSKIKNTSGGIQVTGRGGYGGALQHPLIMSSGNTYDVVFHLSQETAAFYQDVLERGGHGATTASTCFSQTTINMATYLSKNCILGCQRITELNYDVHSLFTPGLRPEIRQDFRMLFACLNDQLLSGSYRARQQFINMEEADRYRYSLFVFISELWRPGCMSVSLLCDSSVPGDGEYYESGSSSKEPRGVLSTLLSLAQSSVSELRSDYRQQRAAHATASSSLAFSSSPMTKSTPEFSTSSSQSSVDPLIDFDQLPTDAATTLLNLKSGRCESSTTSTAALVLPRPIVSRKEAAQAEVDARVRSVKAALERQKLAAASSAAWSAACRIRKEKQSSEEDPGVQIGSASSITLDYLPSNDEMVLALQRETLAHYRALLLSVQEARSEPFSAQTMHVLQYMASGTHSLGGFKQIFELRNDVGVLFTPGTRPEIKKDFRVLFGWHMEDLLNPSYRCRQQFTVESHADLYRRAIFVYITELWKPHSVDESVLRSAYIHVRSDTLCTKSTGVLSMSLLKLQDVVLELRGHLQIVAFSADKRTGDKRGSVSSYSSSSSSYSSSTSTSSSASTIPKPSLATMGSSIMPLIPPAKKQKVVKTNSVHSTPVQKKEIQNSISQPPQSYSTQASTPSTQNNLARRNYLESTLAHYKEFEQGGEVLNETLGVIQYIRKLLSAELSQLIGGSESGSCSSPIFELLAETRRSGGGCLFDTDNSSKYDILFGWFRRETIQSRDSASAEQVFKSINQPQSLSGDFKFALYVNILELWEPKSMPLSTLQKAYCTRVGGASSEGQMLHDLLSDLQEVIMDLRVDFCSSAFH